MNVAQKSAVRTENRIIPCRRSAKLLSIEGYFVAAVLQPNWSIAMSTEVTAIAGVLSFPSHATTMPVHPTLFVIVSDIVPEADAVSPAASQISADDMNIVLIMILPTFIPAYFAVAALSPTTAIS